MIVWHLSLTHFFIQHYESCDQQNLKGILFIFSYQALIQKNHDNSHLLCRSYTSINDLLKITLNVTLSLLQILERYSQIFLRCEALLVKIGHSWWGHTYTILMKKDWKLFRSQFCTRFFSNFYVTLCGQPVCQTVQNYVLGRNFFICGRLLNLDIPNCSAWHLWKFECIWRVWSGEIRL